MNKFGVVLGIAAVATLAGCKDPDYKHAGKIQDEVKNVDTAPVAIETTAAKCTCAPGTKHEKPCTCGAPDCTCVVETKPVITADLSKPAEPEYTIYIVQDGDYLAKISKKFNVTIASIKRLNPSIKKDVVRVGQKLKLPGKIDVPAPAPASAAANGAAVSAKKPAAPKKAYAPYTGATKEYVVQNGDYLAKISKKFNVTIASIKRLNPSIKKDVVRVGQKLKLPGKIDVGVQSAPVATAPVAAAAPKKTAAPKKAFTSYKGATKEYVVQNGDTLGSIAYGNGITIRQLKDLNELSSDALKIGQKLKIPAEKVVKAEKPKVAEKVEKKDATVAAVVAPAAEKKTESEAAVQDAAEEKKDEAVAPVAAEAAKDEEKKAEPAAATTTYVVQEGDDMTGVSIRWGVSAAQIREINNLGESDQLVPGQIIKLPADAQQ